jgi:MFS family permease
MRVNALTCPGMTAETPTLSVTVDESSPRYAGWRVVGACFIVAVFCWGFGLYGHGVYLVQLHHLHGWPASLISTAVSVYYLLSAALVVFISDAITSLGPRRVVLIGTACMATAVTLLAFITAPWQLFAAYLILATGAAAMHTGAITTIVGLWFDRQRGLAISLALNGASFGGILVTPALVIAIERFGFTSAMVASAAIMAMTVVPAVLGWIDRPTARCGGGSSSSQQEAAAPWTRAMALRNPAFWSVAGPFAVALMAQIGFIVHQIAFLEPAMGRPYAGLAVGVMTVMAVVGRILLGVCIARWDARRVTAASVASQAVALFVMTQTADVALLFLACAAFGLTVGNLITLPAVVIQREFEAASFGMLVGLSTAIGQFTCVIGPALLGFVRDLSGGYGASLALCMALQIAAAAVILCRPRSPLT